LTIYFDLLKRQPNNGFALDLLTSSTQDSSHIRIALLSQDSVSFY